VNDGLVSTDMAKLGLGLAYVLEWIVSEELSNGRLQRVLEPFAATAPGYFLYFPSRAQRSSALGLFVDTAKELLLRGPGVSARPRSRPSRSEARRKGRASGIGAPGLKS